MTTPEQQPKGEAEAQRGLIDSARKLFAFGEAQTGFGMHFGEDGLALDKAIRMIGLDEMLETGDIGIISVRVVNAGITSYIGSQIDKIKNLPVSDALVALQIAEFKAIKADKPGCASELIIPGGYISSRIIFGYKASSSMESEFVVDTSRPCVAVGLRRQHLPDFYNRGWDDDDMLPRLSEVLGGLQPKSGDRRRDSIGAVATVMARTGLSFGVSPTDYSLEVGRLYGNSILRTADGVSTKRHFTIDAIKEAPTIVDSDEWEQHETVLF